MCGHSLLQQWGGCGDQRLEALIVDVGLQLFSITINFFTSASALATYFKIGVIQEPPVQYAYLAVTVLSCVNAISSTFYNAVLLRWIVMKEENKADGSIGSRALHFLKFKAPSSHIAFALGLVIQVGLIGLNTHILCCGRKDQCSSKHVCISRLVCTYTVIRTYVRLFSFLVLML